nr:GDP-mannose 4,6-dehydratase [Chloroflexota bacterium]
YGSVIARFAAQALAGGPITVHGDGGQSRCFTYVADTVRGTMLAAAAAREGKPVVYNIGSREEVTIGELAGLVREIVGSRSDIVHVPYEEYYGAGFEDTRRRIPDTERAAADLGFTADVALRDGLARTLAWCRDAYGIATSS